MNNQAFSKILILVIIIIILLAGGFFVWQYFGTPKEEMPKNETSGWKTYNSNKYKYSFQYPDSAKLVAYTEYGSETNDIENNQSFIAVKVDNKTIFSIQSGISTTQLSEEKINQQFGVTLPSAVSKEVATIAGISGYKVKITDDPVVQKNKTWYFAQKGNIIYNLLFLNEQTSENKRSELDLILKKILESFTLLDETANWKAYRSEEYGFEIRYPEDWQIDTSTFKIKKLTSDSYLEIIKNKNESNFTLDEWFEAMKIINGRPTLKAVAKKILINNIEAYRINSDLQPPNCLFEIVGIANSQREIFTLYAYSGQLSDNIVLEKMLSTFKFIEPEKILTCEEWLKECAEEGESRCSPCGCRECCSGLVSRQSLHPYRNTATNEVVCLENMTAYVCVRCGDGVCGKGEDWCICPEDCDKPNPQDLIPTNRF